jgi:E3 ubiquitin-protein ligase RNF14
MIDCGHVFCVQCLQDFYNNAIKEGDLASVRCLAPNCAKKRAEALASTKKNRRPKTQLSPSELLQIPLEHDTVSRYVKLKHKAELESDKNTIYCPRKWCQGAARSKKHRKPDGFEDAESADDESDTELSGPGKFMAGRDLLAVCEDCSFAFCSRCYQGWHGEFITCTPKTNTGELTEEDKKSLEYLKAHSTPCPTCAAPCQKTHGCNHMICFKCCSHFCYLCSAWLSPSNPYQHYNEEKTWCYMRLWELEEGDGDDVVPGGPRPVEIPDEEEEEHEIEAPVEVANEAAAAPAVPVPEDAVEAQPQVHRNQLEREGPLVLRINQVPQAAPAVPAVADPRANNQRNGGPQRPAEVRGQPGIPNGGRRAGRPHHRQRNREDLERQRAAANQEAAQQAWVQMFVRMALNDEEDQLDSDDENEDEAAWEIPVR